MAEFMTTTEASRRWGISSRRINTLCAEGRLSGAYKEGKSWLIPADVEKPVDKRYKDMTYGYATLSEHQRSIIAEMAVYRVNRKLPLPIGISDYKKASSEYYYVDKTLMIRDFLDERPQVSLFTRPRRFGKTLNMDMLRVFFEKTGEDTSVYFRDKNIWLCGEEYQAYQGKYPVIFVTFKDAKFQSWDMAYDFIYKILKNEFERHIELLESDAISSYEKQYLVNMLSGTADENDVGLSFLNLSRMLHKHYKEAPIIIIDEYDTPIQQGHTYGYYDQVISFMRTLFSGGLKDNPHLSYGFLTGILRVAKESIFSGLNNLKINSILDNRYGEYFGFTPEEVQRMADYYGVPEKYDELCQWYDGYRFGKTEIFNPWSVIGYFNNECLPRAFWQATGSNDIIGEVLNNGTTEIYERLESLMKGKSIVTHIDTSVIYPQIHSNPSSIYSFLLVTGYLKLVGKEQPFGEEYMCEVALPNKEIKQVFAKEILARYEKIIPGSTVISVREALYTMDASMLQKTLELFLRQTVSFYDTANENFYHGLVLGLCAILDGAYRITSNREAGQGRFDIQLLPLDKKLPGVLIEIKTKKDCNEEQLIELAETALEQINDRQYYVEMNAQGVNEILLYGIAFSGKRICIRAQGKKL